MITLFINKSYMLFKINENKIKGYKWFPWKPKPKK